MTALPTGTAAVLAMIRGRASKSIETATAAPGASRSPGRPSASRMSCSWLQMSKSRIRRRSPTVVAPNGPTVGCPEGDVRVAVERQPLGEQGLELVEQLGGMPAATGLDVLLGPLAELVPDVGVAGDVEVGTGPPATMASPLVT